MTTQVTKKEKQESYRMTMDLVDLASGRNLMESELVRKVYTK